MVSALRGRKAKNCSYLRGMEGCGSKIENKIRTEFGSTIKILGERLKYETDENKLVHILNALQWTLGPDDMALLARS